MVDNPEEVGLNSLRRLAQDAGVKPATITRLTKKLGFVDYDALRKPFCDRLRQLSPGFAERLQEVQERSSDGSNTLFDDMQKAEVANVHSAFSKENRAALNVAAKVMQDSRRVYVLGLRGTFAPAFLFHYAYQMFRDNSTLLDTRAGMLTDQLRGMRADDCLLVVSFSPYTLLTIDAVEYAAEAGATIVAITDSAVSPAATYARHVICTNTQSPSFYHSLTGALAAVQSLITLLVSKSGRDAVEIIEESEKQLARISAYW